MLLVWSRYLALLFAVGLGIGETVTNWGHWQYAPLWIVDYVIAVWLVWGFVKTRLEGGVHILLSGWAFTSGIFYMALFASLDPDLSRDIRANTALLVLIGFMFGLSVIGFLCAFLTIHAQQSAAADAVRGTRG